MSTKRWGAAGAALVVVGMLLAVWLNSGAASAPESGPDGARAGSAAKKKPVCAPDDRSESAGSLLPGSPEAKQALVTADEVSLILGCRVNAAALPVRASAGVVPVFQPARCAMMRGVGKPEDFAGAVEPPVAVRYVSRARKSRAPEWTVVEHIGLFPDPKAAESAFDAFRNLLEECDSFQETVRAPEAAASRVHLAQVSTGPDWAKWSPSRSAGADGRAYPLLVGHKGNVLYEFDVLASGGRKKGEDPLDALVDLSRRKIPG